MLSNHHSWTKDKVWGTVDACYHKNVHLHSNTEPLQIKFPGNKSYNKSGIKATALKLDRAIFNQQKCLS